MSSIITIGQDFDVAFGGNTLPLEMLKDISDVSGNLTDHFDNFEKAIKAFNDSSIELSIEIRFDNKSFYGKKQ